MKTNHLFPGSPPATRARRTDHSPLLFGLALRPRTIGMFVQGVQPRFRIHTNQNCFRTTLYSPLPNHWEFVFFENCVSGDTWIVVVFVGWESCRCPVQTTFTQPCFKTRLNQPGFLVGLKLTPPNTTVVCVFVAIVFHKKIES